MRRGTLSAAAMSPLLLASAILADDKPREDKDAIQGAWRVTAVEVAGKELASDSPDVRRMKAVTYLITADKFITRRDGNKDVERDYKIDPTQKPKRLDVTPADDPKGERAWKAVYSLDGDTLRICMGPPGSDRPTEVATKEGGDARMMVLKRVPAGDQK